MCKAEGSIATIKEFLESVPPGKCKYILSILDKNKPDLAFTNLLLTPDITLFCEKCNGEREFYYYEPSPVTYAVHLTRNQYGYHFLSYLCRNCTTFSKRFAVAVKLEETGSGGDILKIGELPPFGPPVPSKVINLIGPNRELFLMGRRAENQGMGIGAFSYYRRVIESQKNRIFDEIIKVLRNISGSDEIIKAITTAKAETQFTRAVDSVKYALPESLLIKGHNPLTLLHSALSKGLHAKTDEECLELATSIRVVLSELAERIGQLLKDEKELNEAVSRLLKPES